MSRVLAYTVHEANDDGSITPHLAGTPEGKIPKALRDNWDDHVWASGGPEPEGGVNVAPSPGSTSPAGK